MPTYDLNVLKQKDFLFDSKPIGGRAFDNSEVRTLQCYYQNEKNLLGLGIYLPAKECQLTREKNDVDAIMLKGDYDILVTATTNFYKHLRPSNTNVVQKQALPCKLHAKEQGETEGGKEGKRTVQTPEKR